MGGIMSEEQVELSVVQKAGRAISEFVNTSNYQKRVKIYVLRTKESPTEIYELEADDEVKTSILKILTEQFDRKSFLEKTVVEYDPVIQKNDTHKLIKANAFISVEEAVANLVHKSNLSHTLDDLDENSFSDYMVEFKYNENTYMALGSFASVSRTKKFGWFGNLTDNKLKSLDKDGVVGLNSRIDSLIVGDEIQIYGVQGFERVFELKKVFTDEAKKTLSKENVKKYISAEVLARLSENINNGGRLARRLAKLRNDEERLDAFFNNIDKIARIVGNVNHPNFKKMPDVTYDSVNKVLSVPTGKEEQLINVLSDSGYIAEVSGYKGWDSGR